MTICCKRSYSSCSSLVICFLCGCIFYIGADNARITGREICSSTIASIDASSHGICTAIVYISTTKACHHVTQGKCIPIREADGMQNKHCQIRPRKNSQLNPTNPTPALLLIQQKPSSYFSFSLRLSSNISGDSEQMLDGDIKSPRIEPLNVSHFY